MPDEIDYRFGRLADDLSRVALPPAASIRGAAVKRRRNRAIAAAVVVVAGGVTAAATMLGPSHHSSIQVGTNSPTTAIGAVVTTNPPSVSTSSPTVTAPRGNTPTTSSPTSSPSTTSIGRQLPIAVQSDSQMVAAGNTGPSSSILLPTSCRSTGTTVSATGGYSNGGFVPNVYNRYGDVLVLYVFAAPSAGYAQGIQLGVSSVRDSPSVGAPAPWHVSASFDPSLGVPARCVVAAQPSHDVQLAP